MRVRFAQHDDLRVICGDLRPADRLEVMATRFDSRPDALAVDLALGLPQATLRLVFTADDGQPIAFVGFWQIGPGIGSASMIATSRWAEIAPAAHRYCRRWIMGRAAPAAYRRLECRTMASHAVSRKWLKRLGFVEEGVLRALGKRGEDFIQCAWINPNQRRQA